MENSFYEEKNTLQSWSETDSFTIERYEQFYKFIKHKNGRVLDIGCSTGRGGQRLKELLPLLSLTGIDVVKNRITKAEIFDHIIYASVLDLDLKSYRDSFDYAVAGEVIEHIIPSEVDLFLEKIYSILKPEGTLLLTTPNPNSLLVKLGNRNVFNDPSHFSIISASTLKTKVKSFGFKSIVIIGSGKATRFISDKFPFLFPFGSYLLIAKK
jgi:2-polyprenyl-3-methyl-5-hydroxy-6-metoxy-1,4-benzoquinol methylase